MTTRDTRVLLFWWLITWLVCPRYLIWILVMSEDASVFHLWLVVRGLNNFSSKAMSNHGTHVFIEIFKHTIHFLKLPISYILAIFPKFLLIYVVNCQAFLKKLFFISLICILYIIFYYENGMTLQCYKTLWFLTP